MAPLLFSLRLQRNSIYKPCLRTRSLLSLAPFFTSSALRSAVRLKKGHHDHLTAFQYLISARCRLQIKAIHLCTNLRPHMPQYLIYYGKGYFNNKKKNSVRLFKIHYCFPSAFPQIFLLPHTKHFLSFNRDSLEQLGEDIHTYLCTGMNICRQNSSRQKAF